METKTDNRWGLAAEALVQSQDNPCGILDGQSDTAEGFSQSTSGGFLLAAIRPTLYIRICGAGAVGPSEAAESPGIAPEPVCIVSAQKLIVTDVTGIITWANR
jgi:hypothetical protein